MGDVWILSLKGCVMQIYREYAEFNNTAVKDESASKM